MLASHNTHANMAAAVTSGLENDVDASATVVLVVTLPLELPKNFRIRT